MRWLSLIGIGEDGVLAPASLARLDAATAIYGGARHLALAGVAGIAWPSPIEAAWPGLMARRPAPVAVLASGDPMWFGIGAALARLVPWAEIDCFPAPSALSLACARLGWPAHEVTTVSLCGRPVESVLAALQPGRRVLALSADAATPGRVLALLQAHGLDASRVHLMEALGGPAERVRTIRSDPGDIHPLNLLAIQPAGRALPRTLLPDSAFDHDGQLTKLEVRAVALAALAPAPGGLLWDVGAGAGSIAIEWMRADPANHAIAIERQPDRAARISANAASLGVPGLRVVAGEAPGALHGLPIPDATFVGGGGGGVIAASWAALGPGGRLVANAVTVETEMALLAHRAVWGGSLTRLAVQRLDAIGPHHAFRPAMTVTQYAATKP